MVHLGAAEPVLRPDAPPRASAPSPLRAASRYPSSGPGAATGSPTACAYSRGAPPEPVAPCTSAVARPGDRRREGEEHLAESGGVRPERAREAQRRARSPAAERLLEPAEPARGVPRVAPALRRELAEEERRRRERDRPGERARRSAPVRRRPRASRSRSDPSPSGAGRRAPLAPAASDARRGPPRLPPSPRRRGSRRQPPPARRAPSRARPSRRPKRARRPPSSARAEGEEPAHAGAEPRLPERVSVREALASRTPPAGRPPRRPVDEPRRERGRPERARTWRPTARARRRRGARSGSRDRPAFTGMFSRSTVPGWTWVARGRARRPPTPRGSRASGRTRVVLGYGAWTRYGSSAELPAGRRRRGRAPAPAERVALGVTTSPAAQRTSRATSSRYAVVRPRTDAARAVERSRPRARSAGPSATPSSDVAARRSSESADTAQLRYALAASRRSSLRRALQPEQVDAACGRSDRLRRDDPDARAPPRRA